MANAKETRRNRDIRVPQVRLIDEDGEQIGIREIDEALAYAKDKGLDLVEIVPHAEPPVCRIMDYGKFRFEQAKKSQASKKKQKQVQIKEIKFRPTTDDGDYKTKIGHMHRFFNAGDKVKVSLRFRGREMAHQDLGQKLLQRVEDEMSEIAVVEQRPLMEGRVMVMMLAPRKT